jgi:hypothetical protein
VGFFVCFIHWSHALGGGAAPADAVVAVVCPCVQAVVAASAARVNMSFDLEFNIRFEIYRSRFGFYCCF